MLAYHNDPKLKEQVFDQLQAHYDADEIVKGIYWENGKGCAIGCILHSDDHSLLEERFDIPASIGHLIDKLFEGLPNQEAKEWPLKVMAIIPVGADLSDVTRQFLLRILSDPEKGCLRHTKEGTSQHAAVAKVISLLKQNCQDQEQWREAWDEAKAAAWAAAWEAAGEAVEAAWAAREAAVAAARDAAGAAAWGAGAAAKAAAWAARDAAWAAARDAAGAAAWGAGAAAKAAAWAARDAAWAALEEHYLWMAQTLLQLLSQVSEESGGWVDAYSSK